MARCNIPIDGSRLRDLCRRRDKSLRQMSRDMAVEWGVFWDWLNEKTKVSPETLDKMAEILDCPPDVLVRDTKEVDMKNEMIDQVKRILYLNDIGEERIDDLTSALRSFAPYFLTQPRDEIQSEVAEQRREELQSMIDGIVNAGESKDD